MNYLGILGLALAALPAVAQQTNAPANAALSTGQAGLDNLRALERLGNFSTGMAFDNSYVELHGTPYTVPAWLPGVVYLRRGVKATDLPLKYDAYAHRLLALRSPTDSMEVDLNQVEQFVLRQPAAGSDGKPQEQWRHYQRLEHPTVSVKHAFVEVLYAPATSRYQLYKLPRKRLQKARPTQAFGTGQQHDLLLDAPEYYLAMPDQRVLKLARPNGKSLEAVLAPAEVARLKALKRNVSNEMELQQAVMALDSATK